jgi:hypothetical protein
MSGTGVSLGGDGSSQDEMSITCANIKLHFGKLDSDFYWLNISSTPTLLFCAMNVGDGTVKYDGSTAAYTADTCADIKLYYSNRTSGLYYIKNYGSQVYCDMTASTRK